MKKYYVFLFGIIFIFIFTGCSFLSFNSPISYSEFDVGSSSSETDNIIPHEEDSSSDNNDVSSAESALSAKGFIRQNINVILDPTERVFQHCSEVPFEETHVKQLRNRINRKQCEDHHSRQQKRSDLEFVTL